MATSSSAAKPSCFMASLIWPAVTLSPNWPQKAGDDGHHLLPLIDGVDQLEELALVHDGAEGAVHQTHAAADALILIDLGAAQLVAGDGVHAAGLGTGTLELDDGLIGAALLAAAALDALLLIDDGLALDEGNSVLGAGVVAVVGKAALTHVGHLVVGGGTGVAGVLDDVDEGRIVIFLGDGAFLHAVAEQIVLRHRPQRQPHGKADALAHDGALQKDGFAHGGLFAGHNLIGQLLHAGVILVICHFGHFREHALAGVGDAAGNVSHIASFLCR